MITVNEPYMAPQQKYADGFPDVGGMMHVVRVTLLTHMTLYRFATKSWADDRVFGAPWWVGFSAHDALVKLAGGDPRKLRAEARARLAMLSEWGNAMDLLVSVDVREPLSAWSGTPRTARAKDADQRYGNPTAPDRSITQLYVPGLSTYLAGGARIPSCVPWAQVLRPRSRQHLD